MFTNIGQNAQLMCVYIEIYTYLAASSWCFQLSLYDARNHETEKDDCLYYRVSIVIRRYTDHKQVYCFFHIFPFFTPMALQPNSHHGLLILDKVSRLHTTMHHSRQDSSGRVISPSQRPLPDNTQHSQQTNIHAPARDSNPQSQQASGRRHTPQTARPLGPAFF